MRPGKFYKDLSELLSSECRKMPSVEKVESFFNPPEALFRCRMEFGLLVHCKLTCSLSDRMRITVVPLEGTDAGMLADYAIHLATDLQTVGQFAKDLTETIADWTAVWDVMES